MEKLKIMTLILFLVGFSLYAFTEALEPKYVPEEPRVSIKKEMLNKSEGKGVSYGQASYYGERWNGRKTANGEIFDCSQLTCASPTLPFNTKLLVTNLDNNLSVIVRVNDRGPFKMDSLGKAIWPLEPHPRRVLDLSKKSFSQIGDINKGILNIKYEVVGF